MSEVKTKKEIEKQNDSSFKAKLIIFLVVFTIAYFATSKFFASLGIAIVALIAIAIPLSLATGRKNAENAKINAAIEFYKDCVKNQVLTFTSEKDIARAESIAKAHNCGIIKDYAAYYELGKSFCEEMDKKVGAEEKEVRVAKLLEEERKESAELNKYAELKGNDKTLKMLKEELNDLTTRKNTLANFGSTSQRLLSQQEKDWATAGGFASAVAGSAAGVATALDIQAQNAEIRAHNKQVATDAAMAQMHINSSGVLQKLDKEINEKQDEINKEAIKLVSKETAEEVLSCLSFDDVKSKVTESGTVYVDAIISMPKEHLIFGDVPSRIDGTVIAVVSQNDTEVARVAMVLPKYGVSVNESVNVKGIKLGNASYQAECSVSFEANNLFAIEK